MHDTHEMIFHFYLQDQECNNNVERFMCVYINAMDIVSNISWIN